MYTDGFDELSEAENRPPRTYVSTGSQDFSKMQRENERLKKSLEKEQFFNRLLDQELKDLKSSQASGSEYNPDQFNGRKGVSKGAFNVLLLITIALAGFMAYTLYYNRQYDLFSPSPATSVATVPETSDPAVVDSVPNIIASKNNAAKNSTVPSPVQNPPASQQSVAISDKKTVVPERKPAVPEKKPATEEVKIKAKTPPVQQPVATVPQEETTAAPVTEPPAVVERPVIGKYIISSKANFYNEPDGNTLRSYFISPSKDKIVNALEDKNGFIYVEFKNDVGYVTKGWLSKADLTKQ